MTQHSYLRPSAPLRDAIVCFQVIENLGGDGPGSPQRVTPEGCVELNFNLADPLLRTTAAEGAQHLGGCYAVGRACKSYFIQRTGAMRVVSVRFHPWAAHRFTPMPLDLLADRPVPGIEVFGRCVDELHERLHGTTDAHGAVALLNAYFIQALSRAREEDNVVIDATHALATTKGGLTMAALHARYGISLRRLEQRFKQRIGMAPKSFARLMRFQHSLVDLHTGSSSLDSAFAAGYYDQSHFVREFTAFAGISPVRYLRERHPLNDALVLGGQAV